MRVNLSYLIASQGYLGYSLDSFRLISVCRHGVTGTVALILWGFICTVELSFLFCSEIQQSFVHYLLSSSAPLIWNSHVVWKMSFQVALAGEVKKKRRKEMNKRQIFCLHCWHNWTISKVWSYDFCRKRSWVHGGESCSHSSKMNIVCVTLWHVSEISAGFPASLENTQYTRLAERRHIRSRP